MRPTFAIGLELLRCIAAILLAVLGGLGANSLYFSDYVDTADHVIGQTFAVFGIPFFISTVMGGIAAIVMEGGGPIVARFQKHWVVLVLAAGASYALTIEAFLTALGQMDK